ncbi:hypothetical protein PVAND_014009 [Polypedilum vanderplanki]|uniref:Skp1-related protein n=1 Tax=Polypedilum vanderplanki TaxID=319348 RepID=A0A9J6CSD0_POLVA|nr:hypothetical protein PVAND_014009 [Polypedilum vanderplanki]
MDIDRPSDPQVSVVSSDGTMFHTTLKSILLSGTIKDMIEHIGEGGVENMGAIPLQNVDSKTLEIVIKWIEHHKDNIQPTSEEIKDKTADFIDPWDENFLEMDLDKLYNLITAANYLNIPQLLWLSTRKIAMLIKNRTPQEIRSLFNIEDDWTPQEIEAVQKENQWCEEK